MTDIGLIAIAAAIAIFSSGCSSLGEGYLISKAIEGMARNPEASKTLRSSMIIGTALVETCGIYALLIAILIIFILPGQIPAAV
jgi:F-type H+-transporting ATPase subunit c